MDLHHSHLLIMIITFLIFIIINVASAASIPDASTYTPKGWKMTDRFYGIRYEVFGRVQGVWFRKTTQEMADKLACFGWVQNTIRGTVVGEARCSKVNGPKFEKYLRLVLLHLRATHHLWKIIFDIALSEILKLILCDYLSIQAFN